MNIIGLRCFYLLELELLAKIVKGIRMKIRVWRKRMTRRDTYFFKSVNKLMDLMALHSNKLSKQLQDIYTKSLRAGDKNG